MRTWFNTPKCPRYCSSCSCSQCGLPMYQCVSNFLCPHDSNCSLWISWLMMFDTSRPPFFSVESMPSSQIVFVWTKTCLNNHGMHFSNSKQSSAAWHTKIIFQLSSLQLVCYVLQCMTPLKYTVYSSGVAHSLGSSPTAVILGQYEM